LNAGAVFRTGWTDVELSPQQTYQQALLQAESQGFAKLKFRANAGFESRDFGGSLGNRSTFIYAAEAEYRPFSGTMLSLETFRRSNPSPRQIGENYVATGVSARARQRLFRRFTAGFAATFETYDYDRSEGASDAQRSDDYYVLRPSLAYDFVEWCSGEIFWEMRQNRSTVDRASFEAQRLGLSLTFRY